jgi:hypothetical protein
MKCLLVVLLSLLTAGTAAAEPLSKAQLLDLIGKNVDSQLVLDLVKRDCVAFEVDAATLIELSQKVPTPILQAAMDCRKRQAVVDPATRASTGNGAEEVAPLALREVKKVAVAEVILAGGSDAGITSYLIEQVKARKPSWDLIDPAQLQLSIEATGGVSGAPLSNLLAAARRAGAHAVLLGNGSYYNVMGAPGVALHLRLLEVNRGKVLWSTDGESKGGGFSTENAKHMAVRSATRKLPK